MKSAIRWGLILGAAVAVFNFVFGLAGLHTAFSMAFVFLAVAILMNVTAVVLCLRERAASDGWAKQLGSGLVLGFVGGTVIFLTSWLMTAVVFPDYFAEMAEGYRETFVKMGMNEEEVAEMVAGTAATSHLRNALDGAIGTVVTSALTAAIAGIWLRRKA